jgi:GPH family glycoside/pentoside/hexuronide:cation symporter
MYADVSDYAELEFRTASTGLIFSSASMAQKFGGAIGGAAVLWLLSAFGYVTDAAEVSAGVVQPESALLALRWLMSFIPATVAALAVIVVWFYPLTTKRVDEISERLKTMREIEE